MIIKSLDLIGFGKFHHKQTELGPRVNVIYGGNEAGKSTMHRFIHGMLFGLKRGRGRGAVKDEYTRCKPWENGQCYEGLMVVEHQGHVYRLYRNFYKEDEVFRIFDETAGKQIFPDGAQADSLIDGLNEANFRNTVSIRQQEIRIEESFSSVLQTYMANMTMGKNESVDIGEALSELSEKERRLKRRIHGNRVLDIREQIEKTEAAIEEVGPIDEKIKALEDDERLLEEKLLECREDMKRFQSRERKERMEGRGLLEQYHMTARMLREERLRQETEQSRADHYLIRQPWFKMFIGLTAAAALFMALQLGLRLDVLFFKVLTGLLLLGAFFGIAKTSFRKPEYEPEIDEDALEEQLRTISGRLSPYVKKYGKDMMGSGRYEQAVHIFNRLIEEKEGLVREKEKLLYRQENRDELAIKLEELLEAETEIKERAAKYGDRLRAIAVAKQVIGEVSCEIHETFGNCMNAEAKDLFRHIVGSGRAFYIDEKLNIHIDGGKEQISPDRLSTGTIDQLYFALRLCAGKLMFGNEDMPLILDDAFVFYDDERLKNLLDWLVKNYKGQIIFFTCHRREADLLEELGYDYNYIELQ